MAATLASAILDALLGLGSLPADKDTGNRFTVEGLAFERKEDGSIRFTIRRLGVASLALPAGPFSMELARLEMRQVAGQLSIGEGGPRLVSLESGDIDVFDLKLRGPLVPARAPAATDTWHLAPLAAADGSIHAQILDAHLMFDVDVTVKIAYGQVDFNDATVEHVGPDSRMGISPQGLYVDAPNGRTLLYPFGAAPVAGVDFERRDPLLGLAVLDRGRLRLQPFAEDQLRQDPGALVAGHPEQARLMLQRTAVTGEVQLGDGQFAAPGLRAELVGRDHGQNTVRIRSESLARVLTVDMAALSVRDVELAAGDASLRCESISGTPLLQLSVADGQLRFAFSATSMRASGLLWHPAPPVA